MFLQKKFRFACLVLSDGFAEQRKLNWNLCCTNKVVRERFQLSVSDFILLFPKYLGETKLCHQPPRPTTSQSMSTSTHHQPKYVHHHPPPSTTTHHQPKYTTTTHHYLPFPKKWTTTSFRHCFNSFFFFEMQYSFPWWRFCVIKFWSVRFSNSKFLLHSVHFTIFYDFLKFLFHVFNPLSVSVALI